MAMNITTENTLHRSQQETSDAVREYSSATCMETNLESPPPYDTDPPPGGSSPHGDWGDPLRCPPSPQTTPQPATRFACLDAPSLAQAAEGAEGAYGAPPPYVEVQSTDDLRYSNSDPLDLPPPYFISGRSSSNARCSRSFQRRQQTTRAQPQDNDWMWKRKRNECIWITVLTLLFALSVLSFTYAFISMRR